MNIYDVSERAHVSIATVSRVLNGNPNVSAKTREKVLSVVEELGYTPNVFARGLGLGTMKTVGIMCADASDPYLAEAVYNLEQELRSHGYDSLLCCSGYQLAAKKKYFELLRSKRVDAVILAGSHYVEPRVKDHQYLVKASGELPIVLVNGCLEGGRVYCALCDDRAAMYEAASRLITSGRSRILYLYASRSYSSMQKRQGYEEALKAHGLPRRVSLIHLCPKQPEAAMDLLTDLSVQGLQFDAVLAAEDVIAVGAVKYAHASGIRIPEDLSVIGYNNSILSRCTDPELTSVDNKVEGLCTAAVTTLMKVFEGANVPPKTMVSAELIVRGTTDF